MRGQALEQTFLTSRRHARIELVFFVNAGDPSVAVTFEMLRVLARRKVAAVELCVPFPKLLTDGALIRASHQRALVNGIDLPTVLKLVARARDELGIAIVLLADYGHTVEPLGLARFLRACHSAGAHATLIHGLQQTKRQAYVEESEGLGLGRIMSFFAGSHERVRQAAYRETEGFIYVVSRFGRTGQKAGFDTVMLNRLIGIRSETDKPLAVGFGVKTANDIATLRRAGADAAIIGSAATAVVQNHIENPARITAALDELVRQLGTACAANTGTHYTEARRDG